MVTKSGYYNSKKNCKFGTHSFCLDSKIQMQWVFLAQVAIRCTKWRITVSYAAMVYKRQNTVNKSVCRLHVQSNIYRVKQLYVTMLRVYKTKKCVCTPRWLANAKISVHNPLNVKIDGKPSVERGHLVLLPFQSLSYMHLWYISELKYCDFCFLCSKCFCSPPTAMATSRTRRKAPPAAEGRFFVSSLPTDFRDN